MTFELEIQEYQARWIDYKLSLEIALYVRVKADGHLDPAGEEKLEMLQDLKSRLDERFAHRGEPT